VTAAAEATVRRYLAADRTFVANLLRAAFKGGAEAKLVARLHAEPAMAFELVAEDAAGVVIGHIAFSRLSATRAGGRSLEALALAPLAVAPDFQRRGVGSSLVRAGIEVCRTLGVQLLIVLGDPVYYSRFGFTAGAARRLRAPYGGEAFQALEIEPGALGDSEWAVAYPRAFGEVE
jgi:putative acetyltransferase